MYLIKSMIFIQFYTLAHVTLDDDIIKVQVENIIPVVVLDTMYGIPLNINFLWLVFNVNKLL